MCLYKQPASLHLNMPDEAYIIHMSFQAQNLTKSIEGNHHDTKVENV